MPLTKDEIQAGFDRLCRGFMVPEIWRGNVFVVETEIGTEYVPAQLLYPRRPLSTVTHDELRPFLEGSDIRDIEHKSGVWFARLSAPGYMDTTDLTIHDSEEAAAAYLVETYDDGEEA